MKILVKDSSKLDVYVHFLRLTETKVRYVLNYTQPSLIRSHYGAFPFPRLTQVPFRNNTSTFTHYS